MPLVNSAVPIIIYTSTSYPSVALTLRTDRGGVGRVSLPLGYEDTLVRPNEPPIAQRVFDAIEVTAPLLLDGLPTDTQRAFDEKAISLTREITDVRLRSKIRYLFSAAFARTQAQERQVPLHRYLSSLAPQSFNSQMPVPMITLVSGGKVATTELRVQAVMMVPTGLSSLSDSLRAGSEISSYLGEIYRSKGKRYAIGDEGGYSTSHDGDTSEVILNSILNTVVSATKQAGYQPGREVEFAIDFAANYCKGNEGYKFVTGKELLSILDICKLCKFITDRYPVRFLEDPLAESDKNRLTELRGMLARRVGIVADDLLAASGSANSRPWDAVVVMPDRIGTLTESIDFVHRAKQADLTAIGSHRSGDTEDVFLASFAYALSLPFLKAGGMNRSDRTAKYNELLRIEEFESIAA